MKHTMKTDTKEAKRPLRSFVLLFALFLVLPVVLEVFHLSINLGTEILIMALFAMAYNIMLGTTGLASFGHAAFFGTGAYAVGILQQQGIVNLFAGLLVAILAGTLAAALIGVLVNKKRGIYFGLLTLAFGQMFYIVALRWDEVTGGETGLTGIVRPGIAGFNADEPLNFYYLVLVVFALSIVTIWKITNSPFGTMLSAIKGNEVRTQYLGYNTRYYKLVAFMISGAFSGLAGGLFAWHQFAAYPQTLFWVESGNIVILTLLGGGLSSFLGPVLGAAVFVGAQDLISSYTEHWMLFFGLMFIVIVTAFPNGLPEAFSKLAAKIRNRKNSPHPNAVPVKTES